MIASGVISILLTFTTFGNALFDVGGIFPGYLKFPFVVVCSSIIWLIVTYLTSPEKDKVLFAFYLKTQPGGPGWDRVVRKAEKAKISIKQTKEKWSVPNGILAMILGCILIYSTMFAIGNYVYGEYFLANILTFVVVIFSFLLIKIWKKIKGTVL